jgi:transcriptional regulator with PAS, ATPase and Fis domain
LEKEKMVSMIDEILLSKKKKDSDIVDKEDKNENNPIEKILVRNLQSVKKIADKEGININNLFKKLKNNEQ